MVQVMLGFGTPSTKHSNETLASGPAITFFTSSLRRTDGKTAGGTCILFKMMLHLHVRFVMA